MGNTNARQLICLANGITATLEPVHDHFLCLGCNRWHGSEVKLVGPDNREYCPECLNQKAAEEMSKALEATERWLRFYGWDKTEIYQQVLLACDWGRSA